MNLKENNCELSLYCGGKGRGIENLKEDLERVSNGKKITNTLNERDYITYFLRNETEEDFNQIRYFFIEKRDLIFKHPSLDECIYLKFTNKLLVDYPIEFNNIANNISENLDIKGIELLPHQQKIYELIANNNINNGYALFMEMGTGKTFVAIAVIIKHLKEKLKFNKNTTFKTLVVGPKDALTSWKIQLKKLFKENKVVVDNVTYPINIIEVSGTPDIRRTKLSEKYTGLNIYLLSCDSCNKTFSGNKKYIDIIKTFDMCICDESQFMKNPYSQRAEIMHIIGDILESKPKLILTGTPICNNPMDLWSQLRFLNLSNVENDFESFKNKHLYTLYGGKIYRNIYEFIKGVSNNTYFMDKESVMKDMEESEEQEIDIEFSEEELTEYKKIQNSWKDEDIVIPIKDDIKIKNIISKKLDDIEQKIEDFKEDNYIKLKIKNILTQYIRLQQFTGGYLKSINSDKYELVASAKLNSLIKVINNILAKGDEEKVVIFVQYRHELNNICNELMKRNIEFETFTSDKSIEEREIAVNNFQDKRENRIFISQLKCGCRGITLTSSRNMIYYSMNFSYNDYAQSKARIFRIGQKKKCRYYYLIYKDTIDSYIHQSVKYKGDMAKILSQQWKVILDVEDKEIKNIYESKLQ